MGQIEELEEEGAYDGPSAREACGKRGEGGTFEKALTRLFIVCSLLLLGELLWLFVISPCMPLRSVEISGVESLNRITVLDRAGVTTRTSYFTLNARKAEDALAALPQIERAEVVKKFPDAVHITLYGRVAVALSLAPVNGRLTPVIFDQEGVVFSLDDAEGLAAQGALPILSGLVFENARLGLRLPDFLLPLLRSIKELKDSAPQLLAAISEIHIAKRENESFDLVLYPSAGMVRIRIGMVLGAEKLSYALLLLDVLKERRIDVDEIDFRSDTASYKVRG
jgi:cell division septal protein FtsQ